MKRWPRMVMMVVCGAAGLLPACRPALERDEAPDDDTPPMPVRTARASIGTVRPSVNLIGTIMAIPERTCTLSTQVAGLIAQVAAIEGQRVTAGDLIVQIDARTFEAQLARARAAELRARATLTKREHGPRPDEIEMVRENARQLATVARSLQAKLHALSLLHAKDEISDVKFDEARANFEAAEAESRAEQARLHLLEQGTRPEELAESRAELAAVQAELAAAELAVAFCTLRSAISGVVMALPARSGAFVSPGDNLAVIADTTELFVQVRLPQAHLAAVTRGMPADVWIGGDSQGIIGGSLARISPSADATSGNLSAYILIDNPAGLLRPGMACRVRLWLPELTDALVIPALAVADRDGTPVVTCVRDDRAWEQVVRLGVTTPESVQVLAGLSDGDTVTVAGGYGLPPGCPVRILDAPGPEVEP